MKRLRIYADTSVFGGCFDDEFSWESSAFIQMVRDGKIILLVSPILVDELISAPTQVRDIFKTLPPENLELISISNETERLRDAYLQAGVVGAKSKTDAHHVSLATVYNADLIISWNFKHLVNIKRIREFNTINLKEGYKSIEIRSPKEVIWDETR